MSALLRFLALLSCCLLCTCGRAPVPASGLPNILFILTDDQGIGDLSLHGNDSIQTPHMDALLASSARFSRFYVSPVCAPTRASFLSGLYAPRTGAIFVTRRHETMDDGIMTIPEYLRHAEYRTGLFGKWHNGATAPYDPASQGFEQFLGFTLGHFNDYFTGELQNEDNDRVPFRGDLTKILTDSAFHFMQQESPYPFYCQLAYQAPHTPVQVADKHWDQVRKRGLTPYNTGIYAMIESMDEQIGRLLTALEQAGKLDNTIVIFSSDNGPNGDRYRMGLKGTKGQVDEGSVRVPFGIRMPGNHPANGKVFDAPAAHIDLVPTLLDITGLPVPEGLDGRSLLGRLENVALREDTARFIYTFQQGYAFSPWPGSMRDGHYLYVRRTETAHELYDLQTDPGQTNNIYSQDPLTGAAYAAEYATFAATVARPELVAPPIDLDAARKEVHLLAHEGELLGNTRFQDEYGWANDFFVNVDWNGAYWPITTTQDGYYSATVKYHAALPVRLGLQVDSLAQYNVFQQLAAAPTRQLPVADRIARKEVYPRAWNTVQIDSLYIPANAKRLHCFGGYADEVDTGLWIKEISLRKQ